MKTMTARRLAAETEANKLTKEVADGATTEAEEAKKEAGGEATPADPEAAAADQSAETAGDPDAPVEPPAPVKKTPAEMELPPAAFTTPAESEILDPNAPTEAEKAAQDAEEAKKLVDAEMVKDMGGEPVDGLKASLAELAGGNGKKTMAEQAAKIRAAHVHEGV